MEFHALCKRRGEFLFGGARARACEFKETIRQNGVGFFGRETVPGRKPSRAEARQERRHG